MRVAQRTISRNYMRSLNTSLSKRAESLERGTSGLKFNRLSQNVADGSRAMKIQETRYQSEQQLENTENILLEMNSVDSNLDSIDSIVQSIQEKVLQSMSENYGDTARSVLAKEIANKKEQILQFANAQFGGKYLFSGTNNSTPPFAEKDGKLQFNGVDVEKIFKDDGKFYYLNDDGDKTLVPHSEDIYMDTGLGLKMSNDAVPDPRSAFKVSFSGLDLMGFGDYAATGKNGTQVSGNLYDLLTDLEKAISPDFDKEAVDDMHTQLVSLNDKMRMSRTDLGTRMDFLERTRDRLETDIDNLSETESNLISADPAEEAINMKNCEYVWMAVLQLGSKILPSSLLDYMR